MKKLLAALLIASALASVGATNGQAAVVSHTTFASDFVLFDSCTGESVHIVGEVDFLSTSTVTDNTISGTLHSVFKATGTGLTSGDQYQESVTFNGVFESSLQNGEAHRLAGGHDQSDRSGRRKQPLQSFLHPYNLGCERQRDVLQDRTADDDLQVTLTT
jgi:hypothetical protein